MADERTFVREITPPDEDYSRWYLDTVLKADMVDYAPVKGLMVIKPHGYAIWEKIQEGLDRRFKETGHKNAYFPLLIPESYLTKESEHVKGFSPEVAWVTHGGGELLPERLAIRPTSEAIIGPMYAKWVQSYRDLPLLINQWANVVRWEKVTRPFLRTTEFLWQEGHTAHASAEEAHAETMRMLEVYHEFLETDLAIPTLKGRKTDSEKFAGAVETYSVEAMMGDNRALQTATSHYFGSRFAEAYGIRFSDNEKNLRHAFTTSWGLSTRSVGATVMVHGDERGLVLPPQVAPIQVVIVPITAGAEGEAVLARARQIHAELESLARVELDDRREFTPGWKFNDWEMRGVPLRLEIGPRDLKEGKVTLVRRDVKSKEAVPQDGIANTVAAILGRIQDDLLQRAKERMNRLIHHPENMAELEAIIAQRTGWARGGWCGEASCEAHVKETTGATIRNLPLDQESVSRCLACGGEARFDAVWGRAY